MPTAPIDAAPLNVLIVASWYPGIDDTSRGRFVADQAEALLRTGAVRPLVASFDPALADIQLLDNGDRPNAVETHRTTALSSGADAVNPRGWGSGAGIPVARIPIPEGPGTGPSNDRQGDLRRRALLDLVGRLETPGRGVVHAHTAYPDGYAAAHVAAELGWPLVITEHATFVQRQLGRSAQRRAYLSAVAAASRFIAVSEPLARELRDSVPGIDEKLEVVPNAVAIEEFTPTGMDGRRADELLYVGYRRERKGIVTLLRAFADILEERPAARLRLLGRSLNDEEEQKWRDLADELGIANTVSFEPPADRAGVVAAMRRASVLVHASHRETFGITTIEALASGLPVVAAEAGGITEMLRDQRLGELIPPQDARYLARAVLRTLARRSEFDPAYLRRAAEPFAARTVGERLLAIYSEVHGAGPADGAQGVRRDGPIPWAGRAEPLPARLLLFASDAERAARQLAPLPDDVLARLDVVTRGGADGLPDAVHQVIDATRHVEQRLRRVGLHGPRGSVASRLRRLLRDPLGPIRRRLAPGGVAELRQRAVCDGMLAAADEAGVVSRGGEPTDLICLDAIDYVAAAPLVTSRRVRPAPGGVLWLADRWQSLQPLSGDEARGAAVESGAAGSAGAAMPSRARISDASHSPTTGQ